MRWKEPWGDLGGHIRGNSQGQLPGREFDPEKVIIVMGIGTPEGGRHLPWQNTPGGIVEQ